MHFYQANFNKIKCGRKYYIFLKKKIVRVEVVDSFEEIIHKPKRGLLYLDVGVRVKRVDNGRYLLRPRRAEELYTRNGS